MFQNDFTLNRFDYFERKVRGRETIFDEKGVVQSRIEACIDWNTHFVVVCQAFVVVGAWRSKKLPGGPD